MKTQRHIMAGLLLGLVIFAGAQTASAQVDLYNNTNPDAVRNNPTSAPRFTLRATTTITQVQTYHWNFGRGATPRFIGISRRNGQLVGWFAARAVTGPGTVANTNWLATPNVTLPAGQYNLLDYDVSTWSNNARSNFVGFGIVRGFVPTTPPPPPPPTNDVAGSSCTTGTLLSPIPSVAFQSISDGIGGSDSADCFLLTVGLANGSPFYPPRNVTVALATPPGNASLALIAAQNIRNYYGSTIYFAGQVVATLPAGLATKTVSLGLYEGSYCVQVIGTAIPTTYTLTVSTP